jgi:translation initiation factor IF-3
MRRNEQIRISPVRVIGDSGEQLGVLSNDEAQRLAREAGLDLVEVAPNVRPPVCRVMDYGKWKYMQKKKASKSAEQQLKEVRLRPKTDDNDRRIKVKRAMAFLDKGAKVQFTMRFRGRERAHREVAFGILRAIADEFGERAKIERPPTMDGRNMVMVLAPSKGPADKPASKNPIPSQPASRSPVTGGPASMAISQPALPAQVPPGIAAPSAISDQPSAPA